MKIVVLDAFSLNPGDLSWDKLHAMGEVAIYDRTPPEKVIERSEGAVILLTNKTRLKREHFEALPDLKYVGVLATGYNIVDVEAAKEHGIAVTNVPSYGTDAVAQFVFAHLLHICHDVAHHAKAVKEGRWNNHEDFCFWDSPQMELTGKTMGIIGVGSIGQATALRAKAFGMKVLGYSPRPKKEQEEVCELVSLDELLASSDVISLHCPLNESTRGILGTEAFEKMKQGVIIINTSRGPLIDEEALYGAIQSGKVYAAGIDVLAKEPPRSHLPLFDLPQCYITPHIAWAPQEARARLLAIAIDNVNQFILGNSKNVVNG